jgi:NAD(P)H-hydrate epimerase
MASGLGAFDAARLGAHVHGLAGDLAAGETGETALLAGDVLRHLGRAFRSREEPGEAGREGHP